MLVNAVCKKCSLTKKAIEYYVEQGLVSPQIQENGYRVFSEEDVEKLKKVSILRNLGLPVSDIQIHAARIFPLHSRFIPVSA